MKNIIYRVRYYLSIVGKVEIAVSCILLTSILVIIIYQIILRTVFGQPNAWAEEIAVYLFIWITMICASLAYKMKRHITIKTFISSLPDGIKMYFRLFINLIVISTICIILATVPRILRIEMLSSTVALPIKLPRAAFFSIPLTYSMVSILVVALFEIFSMIVLDKSNLDKFSIIDSNYLNIDEGAEE